MRKYSVLSFFLDNNLWVGITIPFLVFCLAGNICRIKERCYFRRRYICLWKISYSLYCYVDFCYPAVVGQRIRQKKMFRMWEVHLQWNKKIQRNDKWFKQSKIQEHQEYKRKILYLTSIIVPEGTEIKGAMLLCAGGAFRFRGNMTDTVPVAEELAKPGFQCFVVDYRLHPFMPGKHQN